jgi:glyoxylase-like metal-dependent hydrolase (beta-lactamase superfamily II)
MRRRSFDNNDPGEDMKFRHLLAALAAFTAFGAYAQPNYEATVIKPQKITDSIWVLFGEGGNIGLSVGEDGTFMIDDQFAPLTPKILAAIKEITDKPVRFLINTHWHFDHTGGNENMGRAGAIIVAHDNVYKRMSAEGVINLLKMKLPPAQKLALPVITFSDSASFHLNGDTIVATKIPPAHTDGDSFIRFQKANVIHTGDVFASGRYPFIDVENKGSVKGIVAAMDKLIPTLDDTTVVIPGHGPVSRKADVIAYRKMIHTVATRVEAMVKAGKTMQQVVAAKPLKEFDAEWGKFRKTDNFVEIVYTGFALERKEAAEAIKAKK